MVLLNYHELTIDEPADSPAKKQQFRLICGVMVTAIVYSVITTGALRPVELQEGEFPGGDFIYKFTGRDYAASMSLLNSIAGDLKVKPREYGEVMYNLYLDDPLAVNGRRQRFASGILLNDNTQTSKHTNNEDRKSALFGMNDSIQDPTKKELEELAAMDLWKRLKYESQELPRVRAAIATFPFTNGFVSALLHSYKVFPAIRDYARSHGATDSVPVILTTCNIGDSVCTHYVPLSNVESFRLGKPDPDPALVSGLINWKGMRKMLIKIVSFGTMGGTHAKVDPKDEL